MKRIQQWIAEMTQRYNHRLQREIDRGMALSLEPWGSLPGTRYVYVVIDSVRVNGGRMLSIEQVFSSKQDIWDNAVLMDADTNNPLMVHEFSDEVIAQAIANYNSNTNSHTYLFISDADNGKVEFVTTTSRSLSVSPQDKEVSVSLYKREARFNTSHVRHGKWMDSSMKTNAEAMMCEDFWHATTRKNWDSASKSAHDGDLMVHAGTYEAALDRVLGIPEWGTFHDIEDFILYRVRLNNTAKIMDEFLRDKGDSWMETYHPVLHHGYNTFAYINNHEDRDSTSIYIRATALDVVEVIPMTSQEGIRQQDARGRSKGVNTNRLTVSA